MVLRRPSRRPGLSLLEVIISLAVFLMALVGIGFLVGLAGNTAQEAHFRSQAALHCQAILDEVIGGAIGLESQNEVPIDDDPDYRYSLDIESGPAQGLYSVTVHVRRQRPNGQDMEVSLAQLILDPKVVGSHLDAPGVIAESDTTLGGSTTDSSGSSGSTGSTGSATPAAAAAPAAAAPAAAAPAPRAPAPRAPAPAPKAATPAGNTGGGRGGTPAGNTGGGRGGASAGGAKGR
jgi:type II secretory pathway pseudopilin PulG